MESEKLLEIINRGESIDVEFKTSASELNKNVFESICAFLNRNGGHLVLGVTDRGKVEGVAETAIPRIISNLLSSANNPDKLHPTVYFSPQVMELAHKKIIYLYIPKSSQVHTTSGKIFDRNGDADMDITRQSGQVSNLYLRKQPTNSEDRVIPYFELADCNPELFSRVRKMALTRNEHHPWKNMNDQELIHSAGLYKQDILSGKYGMTLAAALLFGKDVTILSALSHHGTDALLRVANLDRYDDRDNIETNLIDSYDRLMAFIAKHLPDIFYLEGSQRISLRGRLFREVVSNLLIHREFASRFPAKLIIERDRVYTENWNRPNGWGAIDPLHFEPFSKNPVIARVFREIGLADKLGSGTRNVFKYSPEYTPGASPALIEGDVFKTIIPLHIPTLLFEEPQIDWQKIKNKVRTKFGVNSEEILKMIFEESRIQ